MPGLDTSKFNIAKTGAFSVIMPGASSEPAPSPPSVATPTAEGSSSEPKKELSNKQKKKLAKGKGEKKKSNVDKSAWGAPNEKKKKAKEPKPIDPSILDAIHKANATPKGEMKDVTGGLDTMAKGYSPLAVEAAWGSWWEKEGYYSSSVAEGIKKNDGKNEDERFIMVIPPPNVTGSLHLGHALTVAVEDTLTRWHRMKGHSTLWVPGTDHAGIATQTVVEKMLQKNEGKSRHDLGREDFVAKVWEWKQQYGNKITSQLRFLGASVDWSREAFTMDERLTKAVKEAFVRFHKDGLVFRENRLVNWSCSLNTAISEIEVDYIELKGRTMMPVPGHTGPPGKDDKNWKYEFGVITSFAYPIEDSEEKLVVATTRLETMLGDTAVAVHPEDARYKHLHGKHVVHPFNQKRIPIVLDSELVDMEKGTGAVKITPAHDPNDLLCGKRHNLEFITVINEKGQINENGGEFEGMMRYDARKAMEDKLKDMGLLVEKKDNPMSLGTCSRSHDVIEPLLKPQWWVNCKSMAVRSIKAVKEKQLAIIPDFHEIKWYRWLEDARDWCVSRQLWWGHRIPAYFARHKGENADDVSIMNMKYNDRWVVERTEAEARTEAAKILKCSEDEVVLEQDEDVLDTWFSSGLFPFSVFGWPDQTPDMDAFFPTSILETGHDILFFWCARMVMMSLQLTDKLPFHTLYLHAMVRDKLGRKMSKSLGNVIDPMEVIKGCPLQTLLTKLEEGNLPEKEIEKAKAGQTADFPDGIPEVGADALRFGLVSYTTQGRDINLDIHRLVGYRNFCNKLWNVTRFTLGYFPSNFKPGKCIDDMVGDILANPSAKKQDKWILSRLNEAAKLSNESFKAYDFGNLTNTVYGFWLYDLCDNYIEMVKSIMYGTDESAKAVAYQVLYVCLETGLRLLHPIMPFVTEELWQRLPGGHGDLKTIMLAAYPEVNESWANPTIEAEMLVIQKLLTDARSMRASYNLTRKQKSKTYLLSADAETHNMVQAYTACIVDLADAESVECLFNQEFPKGCGVSVVNEKLQVGLLLTGLVDAGTEIKKAEKNLKPLKKSLAELEKKMADERYAEKTPEQIREKDAAKMETTTGKIKALEAIIADFTPML